MKFLLGVVVAVVSLSCEAQETNLFPLLSGVDGVAYSIATDGNFVIVGGSFESAGGVYGTSNVARWNGSSWSALGSGTNGAVYSMVVWSSGLVVGGLFTSAGGSGANCVAVWDGSNWSGFGAGLDNTVRAMAVWGSSSDLFVGGDFNAAGGASISYMAVWDGSSWSAVGTVNGAVNALTGCDSSLCAGGQFTSVGVSASGVAMWDGSEWSTLGSGVNDVVHSLLGTSDNLFVGGEFDKDGDRVGELHGVAMLFQPWSSLRSGVDDSVYALEVLEADLFVGGQFSSVGGVGANGIAQWNGRDWSALGNGIDGTVYAMAANSDLFVGGFFSSAGNVNASFVAKWDGNEWSALGSGVDEVVLALAVSGTDLYAGGGFSMAGGQPASYVAKWDGSSWSALGSGTGDEIHAITTLGADVFVGGYFSSAGGQPANYVAKWDGNVWSALGSGVDGPVISLAVLDSDLYAGGAFSSAGGVSASRVAMWDGSEWSALGEGVNDDVIALFALDSFLFAGGEFTSAGGARVNYLAKWDGAKWSELGSGVSDIVHAFTASGTNLFASTLSDVVVANLRDSFPPSSSSVITLPDQDIVSTRILNDLFLFIAVGLAALVFVFLAFVSRFIASVRNLLPSLDLFSLDRYTPEGESPKRQSTVLGGSLSVAMAICVIGIAVNTAVSFFATPDVQSRSLIPIAHSNIKSTSSKFELAMTVSSPSSVACPTLLVATLPSSWTQQTVSSPPSPNATTACSYLMTCKDCPSTDFSTIEIKLPYWFQSATWALATQLPAFPGEPQRRSMIEGGWNGSYFSSTVDTESVRVSVTADVKNINKESETGCVVTIGDVDSTTSLSLSPTLFSMRLSPSGFLFETIIATQSTAASQAISIIIATVSGVVAFFRFVSSSTDSTKHCFHSRSQKRDTKGVEMLSPIESRRRRSAAADWAPVPTT